MLGLFTRLADIYGARCKPAGLIIHDDNGQYTRMFRLWCEKLNHLRIDQHKYAIGIIETTIDVRNSYPPTYAEYLAIIRQQNGQILHPAHKPFKPTKALPITEEQKQARIQKKKDKMAELRRNVGL